MPQIGWRNKCLEDFNLHEIISSTAKMLFFWFLDKFESDATFSSICEDGC
jgi:hypothetical protein